MTTTAAPGGPAAIRGFRLQVLYALHRLLKRSAPSVRLEGVEDVDVLDETGQLVEAVQVKARSAPLTFASLSSASGRSHFFNRVEATLAHNAVARATIATYGPLGPELREAFAGQRAAVASIAVKLGSSADDFEQLLHRVDAVELDEDELHTELSTVLIALCPAATPQTSLRLLHSWLLICAEQRATVNHADVVQQLNAAGQFANECRAYAEEWFRTIIPFRELAGR